MAAKIYCGIRKMKKNNFKIIELKPEKNKNSVKRTVFIKDFIVHEIIGIHDHEKIKKQKIKFNIVIDVNQNTIPDEKDIRSIIDYEKIITKIENLTKSTHYNFLESLAEDSFKEIFEDKRINYVKIKIEKPDAIKNADSVGVEVFKSRSDYEGT
ncbi:MAG: dihydroneopterin aldolase [Alphaproteobacteria bacterium]|nr:MAG: dihydroneopterin aldolase [Alphaproteobacteria bacterium]